MLALSMNLQIINWAAILIMLFATLHVLRRPPGKPKETLVWLLQDLFLLTVLVAFWPARSKTADPVTFALGVVGILLRLIIRIRLHEEARAAAPAPGSDALVAPISRRGRNHDRRKRRRTK